MDKPTSQIFGLLGIIAEQCHENVSENRLRLIVRYLREKHPTDKVLLALTELVKSARRFPTISEIEKAMGIMPASSKDEARVIASKIVGAISRFGSLRAGDAQTYIGPIGWRVVENHGGWRSICDVTYSQLQTAQAQWRDLAESLMIKYPDGLPALNAASSGEYRAVLDIPEVRALEKKL